MLIWSPNSKKCLTHNPVAARNALLAFAASALIGVASPALTFAALAPAPSASALKAEITASQKSSSFDQIIQTWEKKYSSAAFPSLLNLAQDRKTDDLIRYVALMGA